MHYVSYYSKYILLIGCSLYIQQQASVDLRGEPTESIDGNYHRNKTIKFWSNAITCLYRTYMVYHLKDTFTIVNGLLFV